MKRLGVVVMWLFACVAQAAELSIEITRGADNPTSIAVVPLARTSSCNSVRTSWAVSGSSVVDTTQLLR